MVDVAGVRIRWAAARAAEGRVDRDEVDERAARAQLDEAELVEASLDRKAQGVAVEGEGAREVADADDDVVEASRRDGMRSVFRLAVQADLPAARSGSASASAPAQPFCGLPTAEPPESGGGGWVSSFERRSWRSRASSINRSRSFA